MEYFNSLPEEITLDIISRLQTEWVLECKLVCTNWRNLIRHPSFSKKQLHHLNHPAADSGKMGFIAVTYFKGENENSQYFEHENFRYFEYNENHESVDRITKFNFKLPFGNDIEFIGSCNGLICLHHSRYSLPGKTCICNPITRQYIMLPEINIVGMVRETNHGFGYVSSTNDYKVVRIMSVEETKFKEVHVYTLGSGNGWRNLGKFDFGDFGGGVFFSGALYWLDYELKMIVHFDLAEEKFCKLPLSPPPLSNSDSYYRLRVLDGCLSFAIGRYDYEFEATCWDVWLLKNTDDNHGMKAREGLQSLGWSKVFRACGDELFAVTKSSDVLTHSGKHINIYDPEASTLKMIVDLKEFISGVFTHKNTLVSLKEFGEEGMKIMESVEIAESESHDWPFNQL
ncbi:F-box protein At3g07870-like [Papaver somniferum]|uniref:F-box protein At3g07870-like n=1 Tax=Papaver somniferum TaxID=3469 RepID=UPI000E6F6098|nr:F-box protein At3g07870-like [Papaver somniferum]